VDIKSNAVGFVAGNAVTGLGITATGATLGTIAYSASSNAGYTRATFTITPTVASASVNFASATKSTTFSIDNFAAQLIYATAPTYTYSVDVTAALNDKDGSETLGNTVTITSTGLNAGAVLKLANGTVVTDNDAGAGYSWTVSRADAAGLKLTVNKASGTAFSLTASATSTDTGNVTVATGTASTATITMPAAGISTPDDQPVVSSPTLSLVNESDMVQTLNGQISIDYSADGVDKISWNPTLSTIPNIYAGGELVTLSYAVSPNGLVGTVTGSTVGGGTVFTFQVTLADTSGLGTANVVYQQYAELLGTEVVANGGLVMPGGGNNDQLVIGFKDGSGNVVFDAVITSQNVLDDEAATVNTNNIFFGADNNLMNPGERLTMNFATAGVLYSGGVTRRNEIASLQLLFFNFDSSSRTAPDELTITGTTADGGTFTKYIQNADLAADGTYTLTAPGGELITSLVFEAGSQSAYKIGIASISSVQYSSDINMGLSYSLTDADGDKSTGTINLSLDGTKSIIGTSGVDTLTGGAANDTISGGDGNDTIIGGAGDDVLTGGLGADVFEWNLGEQGTVNNPAFDVVKDFSLAQGDKLDLRDLLISENSGNLTNYLHFESDGTDTVVKISTAGSFTSGAYAETNQIIVLEGVNLTTIGTDAQIIQNLITNNKLITD
jgi:hypothetical protein